MVIFNSFLYVYQRVSNKTGGYWWSMTPEFSETRRRGLKNIEEADVQPTTDKDSWVCLKNNGTTLESNGLSSLE